MDSIQSNFLIFVQVKETNGVLIIHHTTGYLSFKYLFTFFGKLFQVLSSLLQALVFSTVASLFLVNHLAKSKVPLALFYDC